MTLRTGPVTTGLDSIHDSPYAMAILARTGWVPFLTINPKRTQMANKVAPVYYDEARAQHLPMSEGTVVDPSFVEASALISQDEGNLLVEGDDGNIRLTASDLVCDEGNCNNLIQTCEDGKLYVAPPVIVSEDEGNVLKQGADGGAYLRMDDMVGGERDNRLELDGDNKFYVPPQNIVSKMDRNAIIEDRADGSAYLNTDMLLSKDDNALELGSDGGIKLDPKQLEVQVVSKMDRNAIIEDRADGSAYLSTDMLLSKEDNALELGEDGGIKLNPDALEVQVVSKMDGNVIIEDRADGSAYLNPDMLLSKEDNALELGRDGGIKLNPDALRVVSADDGNLITEDRADGSAYLGFKDLVSSDRGNLVSKGEDGKLRVSADDLISNSRGNMISVSDGGKLEVLSSDILSDVECNVLDIDRNGKIELCLDIKYNKITGEFELLGNDGKVIKSIQVPTAASVLVGAQLEKDPIGMEKGYYLKMSFKMADGSVEPVYVDVNALSDIYTGGKGINIHDYVVEVQLAPYKSGLSFDKDGCLMADFVTLAGEGMQVEEDPTSLGYQFSVYCCDGLHLVPSVITDVTTGELIDKKYVGINLHPDEQILGLIGSDEEQDGCPYLAAYLTLKVSGDKITTVDRNGRQVGDAIALGSGLDGTGNKISQDFSMKANGDKVWVEAGDGTHLGDDLSIGAGLDATGNKISPDFSMKANGDKVWIQAGDGSHLGDDLSIGSGLDATGNKISPDFTLQSKDNGLAVVAGDGTKLGSTIPFGNGLESTADGGITINTVDSYIAGDDRPVSSKCLASLLMPHNDATTKFGAGTASLYGHVKLTDSVDSTLGANDSVGLSAAAGASLAKRIKALEDAPTSSGGAESPVIYAWSRGWFDGGNRDYALLGHLRAPNSGFPYYLLVDTTRNPKYCTVTDTGSDGGGSMVSNSVFTSVNLGGEKVHGNGDGALSYLGQVVGCAAANGQFPHFYVMYSNIWEVRSNTWGDYVTNKLYNRWKPTSLWAFAGTKFPFGTRRYGANYDCVRGAWGLGKPYNAGYGGNYDRLESTIGTGSSNSLDYNIFNLCCVGVTNPVEFLQLSAIDSNFNGYMPAEFMPQIYNTMPAQRVVSDWTI